MTALRLPRFTWENAFYAFYFPLSVWAFATRHPLLMGVWLMSSIGLITYYSRRNIRIEGGRIFVLFSILAVSIVIPFSLYNSLTAAIHYFVLISCILISYSLSRDLEKFSFGVASALFSFQTYTLIYLYRVGLANYPLENIISGSSSNGITSYIVILQAAYCALSYLRNRTTAFLSSLITLFICFIGFGRGSLLAASLICAMCIAFEIMRTSKRRFFVFTLSILVVPIALVFVYPIAKQFVLDRTKIAGGLYDSHRTQIHEDYFGKMNPISLIIGANYEDTSILDHYRGNPHSSYIRGHHLFGFLYIISLLLSFLLVIFNSRPFNEKLFVLGMLTVILLRASTEPVLFPTPLDLFFYGTIFSFLHLGKKLT